MKAQRRHAITDAPDAVERYSSPVFEPPEIDDILDEDHDIAESVAESRDIYDDVWH